MTKKVLIITYYWPPSGGAGVQRWLKFVKYLREFGWEPIIYTPENAEMPSLDNSLIKDIPKGVVVLKTPIWEPYDAYKKLVGQNKEEKINSGFLSENKKPKRTEKLAVWVRGNFFIPDARKYWIKPSVKYLKNYLKENPVDAIVSTGPPHSMHLIAKELKKSLNVKWLADFRDPWTNIDFYKDLMLSKTADKKHKRLEKEVLQEADVVLSIGNTMGKELTDLGAKRSEVITNGYDIEKNLEEVALDNKFSIAHIGTMTKSRNPEVLWKVLSMLIDNNEVFKNRLEIKLVGKVDVKVMDSIEKFNLLSYVRKIEYMPHDEVILEQRKSHLLLLVVNNTPNAKGILTGKFFEYMSSGRPTLCIGPNDGDVAEIIRETEAGEVFESDEESTLEKYIVACFQGKLSFKTNNSIEKYSRRQLTKKLVSILDSL
jgi:glycosyltransferase involved in cell wall biosynthesis